MSPKSKDIAERIAEGEGMDPDDSEHLRDREEGLLFNLAEWTEIERDLGPDASRGDLSRWKVEREAKGIPTGWPRGGS